RELVGPEANGQVGLTRWLAPSRGDLPQQLVTAYVTPVFVVRAEVVELDEHNRQRQLVVATAMHQRTRELLIPGSPVGDAGEWIGSCRRVFFPLALAQRLLPSLALGDIAHHCDEPVLAFSRERANRCLDIADGPV